MSTLRPEPRQQVALSCPAFELLFGGGKGGGKTFYLLLSCWALLERAHQRWKATGVQQQHARVVVFRKTTKDLADIVIKSHEVFKAFDPGAMFNTNDRRWVFTSGARVEFEHLDGPFDHEGWNGQAIMLLMFDQVEQISFDVYAFLMAQVRTGDDAYRDVLGIRCTANPGGQHGDWVKQRFFLDECPKGEKIFKFDVKLKDGRTKIVTRVFIPSTLADNKYLNDDGQYEANLRANLPEHLLKMWLESDWNVVVGAYFASLLKPQYHLTTSKLLPCRDWEKTFGIDWGSEAPASTHWATKSSDGIVYIVDELYTPGDNGRLYGEKMLRHLQRQEWCGESDGAGGLRRLPLTPDDFWGVIDKQSMDNYGGVATAGAGIMKWGFRLFEANKSRDAGINQIRERLTLTPRLEPNIVIFEDKCPHLVKALRTVAVNPRDAEDYSPDDKMAHAIDSLRFLLMVWPLQTLEKPVNAGDEDVARWQAIANARSGHSERPYMSGGYD